MVVPRLHSATGSAQLRTSAARLLVAARYARDLAVTHRCACLLVIDSDEQCYGLLCQVDPEHRPGEFRPFRTGIGKSERLGGQLRFGKVWIDRCGPDGLGRHADGITFTPTGGADAAVIQITDGRRTVSIVVAPNTAQVKLVEGAVAELPNDRVDLDE
jgi:hypothetical protein